MENKVEGIIKKHEKGYNCAQAVACAYCEELGVDEKDAFRAVEGFGRGMSIMGTCGAVSAMAYLVGLKNSDVNLDNPKSKAQSYNILKPMAEEFIRRNQSVECRTLKGLDSGVVLRSCAGCMQDAAEIIEEYLMEK